MSNVIRFPSGERIPIGQVPEDLRPPYTVIIRPTPAGFDWDVDTDGGYRLPAEDDVASDLAAIALSLRPPKRTFIERLRALFTDID